MLFMTVFELGVVHEWKQNKKKYPVVYLSCGAAIHSVRPGTLSHGALFLSPEWEPSTTSTSTEFKINFITQEICLLG